MNEGLSPVNITAAALIAQFSLAMIIFIGAILLRSGEPPYSIFRLQSDSSGYFFVTLGFALITIGCLIFSDGFSSMWKPVLSGVQFEGFPWSMMLRLVFAINIVWITILVFGTGGSAQSPFSPIYFIVTPLAIFLRQSLYEIALYFILIAISFSFNLVFVNEDEQAHGSSRRSHAYWFISFACFALATFIGYVTRPK